MTPDEQVRFECPPVDLRRTLGPIKVVSGDPASGSTPDGWWWATRTADGPATIKLAAGGPVHASLVDTIEASAWGPGAATALLRCRGLVGADDPVEQFRPDHPTVQRMLRENDGWRLSSTGAVFEALVPTILGQKVIAKEASRSYRRLVRRYGEPAPGPADLWLAPDASTLATIGSHEWHPLGVERKRAEIVARSAREASRLEACAHDGAALRRRLESIRGIAGWTAANVCLTVLGDPDAVVVGDYNLPNTVAWMLAGEARADDERMLELLEPFRGDRARVQRLANFAGSAPPRRGPKLGFREIERS